MCMKKNMKFRLVIILALLMALPLKAQDKKNMFNPVNYTVTSLAIAPDARGGALGDLGAATEADANSQYWNPAKYPFNIARAGVSASYTPWLRKLVNDIHLANLAGFYRIGDYSALSASLRFFSLGEVYLDESKDAMTINPYDYTAESKAGKAFAADIAMYRNGYFMMGNRECSFAWGLNINNIGSKISYGGDDNSEFIPTNLRLGANMTVPFNEYNKLSIAADANKLLVPTYPKQKDGEADEEYTDRVQREYYDISPISGIFKSFHDAPNGAKEEFQEIQWSLGMEYSYNDRFMVRLGYHHEHENKGNRKYVTAGAGFKMSVFAIDAAYVFSTAQSNPLDQTMRFTLSFDLDGMKDLFGKRRSRR